MSIRKWSITTLCCVVIFGALALFKVMEIRAAIAFGESFPEHSETVEEARVESTQYTPVIEAIGEMVAPQRLDLRNELAGEITHVNFRSGDTVTKGQILLQLDTSVETANLAAAKARAQLAQSVYARSQNLFKSKPPAKTNWTARKPMCPLHLQKWKHSNALLVRKHSSHLLTAELDSTILKWVNC